MQLVHQPFVCVTGRRDHVQRPLPHLIAAILVKPPTLLEELLERTRHWIEHQRGHNAKATATIGSHGTCDPICWVV